MIPGSKVTTAQHCLDGPLLLACRVLVFFSSLLRASCPPVVILMYCAGAKSLLPQSLPWCALGGRISYCKPAKAQNTLQHFRPSSDVGRPASPRMSAHAGPLRRPAGGRDQQQAHAGRVATARRPARHVRLPPLRPAMLVVCLPEGSPGEGACPFSTRCPCSTFRAVAYDAILPRSTVASCMVHAGCAGRMPAPSPARHVLLKCATVEWCGGQDWAGPGLDGGAAAQPVGQAGGAQGRPGQALTPVVHASCQGGRCTIADSGAAIKAATCGLLAA